jgi:hypothetical protein
LVLGDVTVPQFREVASDQQNEVARCRIATLVELPAIWKSVLEFVYRGLTSLVASEVAENHVAKHGRACRVSDCKRNPSSLQ